MPVKLWIVDLVIVFCWLSSAFSRILMNFNASAMYKDAVTNVFDICSAGFCNSGN